MNALRGFVENGGVVYLALLFLAVESTVLAWVGRHAGARLSPLDCLFLALPGACLLLALLAAQRAGDWRAIALALGVGLVAHLGDVWRRWQGGSAASDSEWQP